MARRTSALEKPDAVVYLVNDGFWQYLCGECGRVGNVDMPNEMVAYFKCKEHLKLSHGMDRVWIDTQREGYRELVQLALPGVVAHNLQTPDRIR